MGRQSQIVMVVCVVDARNTGANRFVNSVWWPWELQLRPTCLIRNRRELRNRKNITTQRCFPFSLWLTCAWNSTFVVYNTTISFRTEQDNCYSSHSKHIKALKFHKCPFLLQFSSLTPPYLKHVFFKFKNVLLISYNWNYLRDIDVNRVIMEKKRHFFLRLPLHVVQKKKFKTGFWKQVHYSPHLSGVNWLLESISSSRISLLPEPYQCHFIIPANKTAIPNKTKHVIISEPLPPVQTLSRLQCKLRCHQFPGGVLHLLTWIKHSISFVHKPHSHSALPVWELQHSKTRAGCWKAQWEFYQSALANPLTV